MRTSDKTNIPALLCSLCFMLAYCSQARAQMTYWIAQNGDFFDVNNWDNGPPVYEALISNGGTARISSAGIGPNYYMYIATGLNEYGKLEIDGNADVRIANVYMGTADIDHTGGKLTMAAVLALGVGTGRSSTYSISGDAELILTNNYSRQLAVGSGGVGTFKQSGGLVSITRSSIFVECSDGDLQSTYELSGGRVIAQEIAVGYHGGNGLFHQSGGNCTITDRLIVTDRYELLDGQLDVGEFYCPPDGLFSQTGGSSTLGSVRARGSEIRVSGGSMNVTGTIEVSLSGSGGGTFRIIGADSQISAARYRQEAGLLVSDIDRHGIAAIDVSGQAFLDGDWQVTGDDAPIGIFDVLTADGGISGQFSSVTLPGPEWSWGIQNGTTLWVENVPEPAMLGMLVMGSLAVIRRRRRKLETTTCHDVA